MIVATVRRDEDMHELMKCRDALASSMHPSERMSNLSIIQRPLDKQSIAVGARLVGLALAIILSAACGRTSTTPQSCLQFSSDLMPDLAGGLIRKDFRIANAWAVKSDQMIDSSGVKFPAYFLSADIIAPNGEAVPATWVTTQITKPGLIWSLSPQAKKYTSWAKAGDSSTANITMESAGAKESVACVLSSRPTAAKAGVNPKP